MIKFFNILHSDVAGMLNLFFMPTDAPTSHLVKLSLPNIYPPQKKLQEGNVSMPVCQSFCCSGRGVCFWVGVYTPLDAPPDTHPLGHTAPLTHTPRHPHWTPPGTPAGYPQKHARTGHPPDTHTVNKQAVHTYWNAFLLQIVMLRCLVIKWEAFFFLLTWENSLDVAQDKHMWSTKKSLIYS